MTFESYVVFFVFVFSFTIPPLYQPRVAPSKATDTLRFQELIDTYGCDFFPHPSSQTSSNTFFFKLREEQDFSWASGSLFCKHA
jgi:hypothetical protein